MAGLLTISPWQLGLRFALEITSLVGLWAGSGAIAPAFVRGWLPIALPIIALALWTTFAVRDDPSRSGRAPFPVPGWLRLVLELAVFGGGAVGLAVAQWWIAFGLFCIASGVHHFGSRGRLAWLIRQ